MNARAQFVVVGEVVNQRIEAADLVERFAADGERGAESIAQAAGEHARQQHTGLEVSGDSEGLEA